MVEGGEHKMSVTGYKISVGNSVEEGGPQAALQWKECEVAVQEPMGHQVWTVVSGQLSSTCPGTTQCISR
jgi:hypothetical protein